MKSIQKFFFTRKQSFSYAFQGLWHIFKTQKNIWIHATATLCVILLAVLLSLSRTEWAILIIAIGMVWMAEAFNTAIEAGIDLFSPERHPLAKIAKDASAAAVLIAAFTSVAIGILILGPPLYDRIIGWLGR